jgi:hypothetical protein
MHLKPTIVDWINVQKYPPEEGDTVWGFVSPPFQEANYFEAYYINGKFYDQATWQELNVTYYCLLPIPPIE